MTVDRRLAHLEKTTGPPGGLVVCWLTDCPKEDEARRLAEAKAAAGDNGVVLVVVYENEVNNGTD